MPYFMETSISFSWVCWYNKLNEFNEGNLVFTDVDSLGSEISADRLDELE